MAKYCANCGAQMADEDRVCSQCGTPVVDITPVSANAPASAAAPVDAAAPGADAAASGAAPAAEWSGSTAKAKSSNKVFIIAGAAIAAIVLLVVAVNILGNFTGYKGTLNKMTKALRDDDIAKLETLASSVSEEYYGARYGHDLYDFYEDRVSDVLDKYEDSVGAIKKISYEITDETEWSDRRLAELKDELIDRYHMDTSSMKKVVRVELQMTVKGAKKSSTYRVSDLYMIKESGGWKIYYGNLG